MPRLIRPISATSDVVLTPDCGTYYRNDYADITFWTPKNEIELTLDNSVECGGIASAAGQAWYRSQCCRIPAGKKARIDANGWIENQNAGFDTFTASVGSASLSVSSNGGSSGCTMQNRTAFCEWISTGSITYFYFSFDSGDARWHKNARVHFTVTII